MSIVADGRLSQQLLSSCFRKRPTLAVGLISPQNEIAPPYLKLGILLAAVTGESGLISN